YKLLFQDGLFQTSPSHDGPVYTDNGGVYIPEINIPENETTDVDMMGLIVYNGKIYTQTTAALNPESAESLLGEKLGTTKGNLNEWSNQKEYSTEFASSIGEEDVYSVKGYDDDYHIMAYSKSDGDVYAELFESFNDIKVNKGKDFFGKLKLVDNVENAQYQSYSNWNNSINSYIQCDNLELVNTFLKNLNQTKPILYEDVIDATGGFRNDESYRDVLLNLNNG